MVDRLERTPTVRARIDVPVAIAVWFVTWVVGQILFQVVIALSGADGDSTTLSIGTLSIGIAATWASYLAGLAFASQKFGSGRFQEDYALEVELVDLVGVPIGMLTQLVLIPLVYVPLRGIWPDTFTDDRLEETARDLVDRATGASAVLLVLVVAVGAPIVEELVFRGLLQHTFAARINEPLALLAASAWFALIHFRPVEYPGLFIAGLVFGSCMLATGRLGTAIIAHAAFNATGLLTAWQS